MLAKIQSFYGFTKMPFGRDIPPGQLHRHAGHAEAVARLAWAITTRSVAVLTGEFGAGKTAAVRAALARHQPGPLPAHLPAQPGRHRHPRHLPAVDKGGLLVGSGRGRSPPAQPGIDDSMHCVQMTV